MRARQVVLLAVRWWPLAGVAALAAALRWYRIDAQSLWYDEGISAHQLSRSFAEILRAAALDTHPPLYYWTLKAWGETIGASELGLRSLSAVCGVLAVGLTFFIGRRLFGTLPASLAALLLAVAPLAVYYSQEVRMYTQVTALALLAAYGYVTRRNWLYALAAIATLYTQYLGVALLVALNIHAVVFWRSRPRRDWMAWLGANAVVALAFAPWLPAFIDQQTHALNVSPRTAGGLLTGTLTAYGGGLAPREHFLAAGGILAGLGALGWLAGLAQRRTAAAPAEATTLAALLWLVPLGLVLGLGLRSGLFELRYLVLGLPGLLLLVGYALVNVGRHPLVAIGLAGALMVPAGLALRQQYFDPALARDDYRGLVADIARDAQPTDAVVLSAPNQVEVFGYYYRGPLATIGLPAQRPIDAADTRRRLDEIKAQYRRVWLVAWAMNEADPPGVIKTWLAENGFQATHQWYGTVQLELVGFGPSDVATEHVEIPLDNGVVLEGYRLSAWTFRPGDTLALTLVWRSAQGPTPNRWKVFTHLLDSQALVVAQRDAEPADSLRPTTTWAAGERIADNYGIVIPPDLPAGTYTLEIGMYDGERRSTFEGHGNHLVLGQIRVE
jgi:mannosyltransferase